MSEGSPLRVMVIGAAGRMGQLTAATVAAEDDMRLVAVVDPVWAEGGQVAALGAGAEPRPASFGAVQEALAADAVDVAVDFTVPDATFGTVSAVLRAGVDAVVGTTGLSAAQIDELDGVRRAHKAHLFIAPNFALGAVLLMRFAQEAARYYPQAEIIELHHTGKIDAPSGTALRTARLMREAEGSVLGTAGEAPASLAGAPVRSGEPPSRGLDADGVRIHSVRLPGLIAHQEVLFGAEGETLSLRHDSTSRASFMAGVLLAVRRVRTLEETVVGLEHLLT